MCVVSGSTVQVVHFESNWQTWA